jgi:hypothetical protein
MPLKKNSLAVMVPGAVLAIALGCGTVMFACSSSSPTSPLVTGGSTAPAVPSNEGEAVQPISAKEQAPYNPDEVCASQCMEDFAAGAALLQTLDDCNVERCYGDEDDSDTTTKACSAIGTGPGQVSYGLTERDRCLSRSCCAEATACSSNASCSSLASCIDRCQARR